jgi:two-component system, chemotaxis family, chemotaxis protein CheY
MSKILLIDDSAFSRNGLKRVLGEAHTYCEAGNGTTGLKAFVDEKPDLVILDLTMPDLNGLEVLETLKRIQPDVRVIINSADIQDYNREKALELGALGFVNKPIQKEALNALVAQILGGK